MKQVSRAALLPLMLLLSFAALAGAALYEETPACPAVAEVSDRCPVPRADATETVWEAFSRKTASAILFR